MNLKALLDKKNIILNLNVISKKRLVEFLASRLADTSTNISEDDVIKNIYKRERIGNTYIGRNIYFPHCRVDGLISTKIVIATLKNKYHDDRIKDNIYLAVAVFFPAKVSDVHTNLLKELATLFKSENVQSKLREIVTVDELYQLIVRSGPNE